MRFCRVWFQTPSSVNFWALTEFRGENSVRFSQPIIFVCQSELTEFCTELTEFATELSEFSLPKQRSQIVFRLFPIVGACGVTLWVA